MASSVTAEPTSRKVSSWWTSNDTGHLGDRRGGGSAVYWCAIPSPAPPARGETAVAPVPTRALQSLHDRAVRGGQPRERAAVPRDGPARGGDRPAALARRPAQPVGRPAEHGRAATGPRGGEAAPRLRGPAGLHPGHGPPGAA